MGKKLYIDCDKLLTIKESMANGDSVCHADSCHAVNEAAPEVDEYEIGDEGNNPPVGGNVCHVNESMLNFPEGFIEFLMKKKPDKFSNWVVFDLNNLSTYPRYFQKRQTAYDFYKWMKMDYNCKPKLLNLDKINNVVNENYDIEVNSSDIDLSSFKKRDELVPSIWENGVLNSRIRLKLLDIADDFWKFVNLTWVEPRGIILTGSICNFNWSSFSDIDLHLIVDFDEIDEKTEFVRDYLDAKKNEWNNEHENLRIFGHQVELYVQNLDEMPHSNGIYDLEENDWIRKPNPDEIKSIGLNKFSIKDKAAEIMTIIDNMYDALASTDDDYEVREIGDDADYLWKKVKEMRKSSLDEHGESGSGNIVYKILRRTGYLDRLWKLSNVVYDKSNSINESVSEKPTDEEYYWAKQNIYSADNIENYDYCKDIIDRYEADDRLYDDLNRLSTDQFIKKMDRNSEYICTNGKLVKLHCHASVRDIGLRMEDLLEKGFIRIIGGFYSNYVYVELTKYPNENQERTLFKYLATCNGDVYVDITYNGELKKNFCFDRKTFSAELILKNIKNYFNTNESIESHKNAIMLLKEEWVGDGNSEHNPYQKRWDAEKKALKDFVSNCGQLMQSRENGKLYKVYFDKWLSNLIGYNYCICVQWDSVEMKPKSVLYIRAMDKFTPNIKQVNFDTRGRDNMAGTYDDINTY
jgi:hypothetical protein